MIVDQLYQRAVRQWWLPVIAFAIIIIVGCALVYNYVAVPVLGITILGLSTVIAGLWWFKRRPTQEKVINHIHQMYPTAEYSLDLLISSSDQLSDLEKIQVQKLTDSISPDELRLPHDIELIRKMGGLLAVSLLSILGLQLFKPDVVDTSVQVVALEEVPYTEVIQKDTLILRSTAINIAPPAYTRKPSTTSVDKNLTILEGSTVNWKLSWEGEVTTSFMLFEGEDSMRLHNNQGIKKQFFTPSYYKYGLLSKSNNILSEYHAIKVVEDKVPVVSIAGIEEYQRLTYKDNYNIAFEILGSDDYAVDSAHIVATIAKGQGESVKFRERKYKLPKFKSGNKMYQGKYQFQTGKLDMEPGDELYFYVAMKDNCPYREQWSRTATYFVMIEDTSTYFFAEDQGMQVDLMPAFFRSQRQIIIDSEQLLEDRASISVAEFNRRSNELGFDQKQLRLKYGQFLGEESESGIAIENEIEADGDHDHEGHDHESHDHEEGPNSKAVIGEFMHDHDHEDEHGALMSTKGTEADDPTRPSWVEELSHNHDNMEEATFHKVATKSKLKAALSEMWDAELHLRLYDPATSLPYQNKSLILLQEIKNHARIYVHRVGFDPPAIKEAEKRLSGDLDEINAAVNTTNRSIEDITAIIKAAYQSIVDKRLSSESLIEVSSIVASSALEDPSLLPLLNDLERLLRGDNDEALLTSILTGLSKLLPSDVGIPVVTPLFDHPITREVIREIRTLR